MRYYPRTSGLPGTSVSNGGQPPIPPIKQERSGMDSKQPRPTIARLAFQLLPPM